MMCRVKVLATASEGGMPEGSSRTIEQACAEDDKGECDGDSFAFVINQQRLAQAKQVAQSLSVAIAPAGPCGSGLNSVSVDRTRPPKRPGANLWPVQKHN